MLRQALERFEGADGSIDEFGFESSDSESTLCSYDLDLDVKARLFGEDEAEYFDLLTVFLSGLPKSAALNSGIRLNDDTFSLAVRDLDGLGILLPENFPGGLTLRVEAIARDLLSGESVARRADIDVLCDDVTAQQPDSFDPLIDQVLLPAN